MVRSTGQGQGGEERGKITALNGIGLLEKVRFNQIERRFREPVKYIWGSISGSKNSWMAAMRQEGAWPARWITVRHEVREMIRKGERSGQPYGHD